MTTDHRYGGPHGTRRPHLSDDETRDSRIVARIETSLRDRVDDLAARMDVSRSWVARRALIEYVEAEKIRDGRGEVA